ncbi:MAG: hypothetical protein ACLPKB_16630 [Xanthobacteraceae bacterium]
MAKLATFPPLDNLVELAVAGADIRPALLAALTDMYVQRPFHTREEDQQYCELVQRLLESVDRATRAAVAAKLFDYPATPPALLKILAQQARPEPEQPQPPAAASRELAELFAAATSEERRLILIILDLAGESLAEWASLAAIDTIRGLESLALQRRTDAFVTRLARVLDVSEVLGRWIVEDARGEPIIVAAKSIGMPVEILQRVLLFVNPAISHSIPRVYALVRLYEEITTGAARQLVAIWREAHPRAASAVPHVPVHWPDAVEAGRHRPLRMPGAASLRDQQTRPIAKGKNG